MALKTLKIALFQGGKLEARAMGEPKDVEVGAHEPVEVPAKYALDLLENRFAYRPGDDRATKKQIAAAEKAAAVAKFAREKADEAGRLAAEATLPEAEAEPAKLKG